MPFKLYIINKMRGIRDRTLRDLIELKQQTINVDFLNLKGTLREKLRPEQNKLVSESNQNITIIIKSSKMKSEKNTKSIAAEVATTIRIVRYQHQDRGPGIKLKSESNSRFQLNLATNSLNSIRTVLRQIIEKCLSYHY